MRRALLLACLITALTFTCFAQSGDPNAPASKEDMTRYFDAIQYRELTKKMVDSMAQGMHPMLHEMYLKHKDTLPLDYEVKMSAEMTAMLHDIPMDDIIDATIPIYQKHLTKGDVDNMVAFYSTPTGQKLLREMPAIMAEAMQSMAPVMSKYMDKIGQRLQSQTKDMIANAKQTGDHSQQN